MPLLEALQKYPFNIAHVRAALMAGESPNTPFTSEIHSFDHGSTSHTAFCNAQVTPLIYAIEYRLEEAALLLLDYGAEPNPMGFVVHPLNLACKHGLERVVKRLLERNAHTNLTDRLHGTPILEAIKAPILAREPATGELTVASIETTKNIITHLINAGVRLNPEDNTFDADTPIYVAAKADRWSSKQMVHLLMDWGATINLQDRDGITFLECLANTKLRRPSFSNHGLMMRPYGRCWDIGDTPEYFFKNNVYEDFDTTLIESILGRLLSNAQYNDISELITAVKEAEVTDERRETLSIVNGCLACATSVLDKVSLVGGVDSENPLSHVNILSFLNLYEQCMFVEALDWKNPPSTNAPVSETAFDHEDDSKHTSTHNISNGLLCYPLNGLGDVFDGTLPECHFTVASEEMEITRNRRDDSDDSAAEPTILSQRLNFFEQRMLATRHSGASLFTNEPTTETAFSDDASEEEPSILGKRKYSGP